MVQMMTLPRSRCDRGRLFAEGCIRYDRSKVTAKSVVFPLSNGLGQRAHSGTNY